MKTFITRRKPANLPPLSPEALMSAMVALKVSVKILIRKRRNAVLRRELKGDIAALREITRWYCATEAYAEERRAA